MSLFWLVACGPSHVALGEDSASPGATEAEMADALARIDALEARAEVTEAALAAATTRLDADDAALADAQLQIDALAAQLGADELTLAALETEVDNLPTGSGGGAGVTVAGISERTSFGGDGAAWSSIMASALTVSASAGDTVVAWCSLTNADAGTATYRVTLTSDDGAYTEDAEATGDDNSAQLQYSGEALTAPGFWTVPSDGDYVVDCEGKHANGYDVTLLAMVVPA